MALSESAIMRMVMLKMSEIGSRVFRNNVGVGWTGNIRRISNSGAIHVKPGDIVIENSRPLHSGLCTGSSDLIGWTPLVITSDMVGKTVALFTAAEIKSAKGKVSSSQKLFIDAVNESGGIGFVARSDIRAVTEVKSAKDRFRWAK